MNRRLPALGGVIALAGCAVGPNYHRPAEPTTDSYTAQKQPTVVGGAVDGGMQTFVAGQDPPAQWWHEFGSADLDALVAEALRANPNVQAAEAALRQAQENVAAGRGAYFPQVQLTGDASRNRNAVQVLAPTLSSGAPIFNPELLIAWIRFPVARDTVDPEVSAIGIDDQPYSSNFNAIPNGTRLGKGTYDCAGRND